MKQKRRLTLILIFSFIMLAASTATFVHAFFYKNNAQNAPQIHLDYDGRFNVEVFGEHDGYFGENLQYGITSLTNDSFYNSHFDISNTLDNISRRVLVLQNDITLTQDLYITADIEINLNGKTLNLGGNTITYSHNYLGVVNIYNGSIDFGGGYIYLDIANANFLTNNVTYQNGDGQNIVAINAAENYHNYIAYSAFYEVASIISTENYPLKERLNYGNFTQKLSYTTNDFFESFASIDGTIIFYTDKDLDLPYYFKGLDYVIKYDTGGSLALSNFGKVTLPENSQTVNVTAKVLTGVGDEVADFEFEVCVINSQNHFVATESALDIFTRHFNKYFDGTNYVLKSTVMLPKAMSFGVNCTYDVFKLDDDMQYIAINNFIKEFKDKYLLTPNVQIVRFKATLQKGAVTQVFEHDIEIDLSGQSQTSFTKAQNFIYDLFSDTIVISPAALSELSKNNYTRHLLRQPTAADIARGVLSVEYFLTNNTFDVYQLEVEDGKEYLQVKLGMQPENYIQTVLLTANVNVQMGAEQEQIQIQIPIVYSESGDPSDNTHHFTPYYTHFNSLVLERTNGGFTATSFYLPFTYSRGIPMLVYTVLGDDNNAVSFKIYYDGQAHSIDMGSASTFMQAFDNYLIDNFAQSEPEETKLQKAYTALLGFSDLKWLVDINAQNIGDTNTQLTIYYNYKFGVRDTVWKLWMEAPYEEAEEVPKGTSFTLAAVLQKFAIDGVTRLIDDNLYKWIYESFNPTGAFYTNEYAYMDWLSKNIKFENISNALAISGGYYGLQFLEKVSEVNLSGTALTIADVDNIVKMPELKILNLSGTSLTDRTSGVANGLMAKFTQSDTPSQKFAKLTVLDLSANSIYDFTQLEAISSLSKLYTYNNISTGVDSVVYGANGITNIISYNNMAEKGVEIFSIELGQTPVSYKANQTARDVINLNAIEYQKKLKTNVDIANIYSTFSTNINDYMLKTSYTYNTSQTVNVVYTNIAENERLVWGHTGLGTQATYFTLTYKFKLSNDLSKIYSIVIKFNIERI